MTEPVWDFGFCLRCGAENVYAKCRYACPRCGFVVDCSDTFTIADYASTSSD